MATAVLSTLVSERHAPTYTHPSHSLETSNRPAAAQPASVSQVEMLMYVSKAVNGNIHQVRLLPMTYKCWTSEVGFRLRLLSQLTSRPFHQCELAQRWCIFHGHRPNPVRTAHSFPSRYLGGADKDGDEDDGVRRDFRDTVLERHVVTNASGVPWSLYPAR